MIHIYIPTRGRIEEQLTWKMLPPQIRSQAILVCPPGEVREHHKRGRDALPCPVSGIAKVRRWIIGHAQESKYRYIGVLDDDLTGIVYTAPPRDIIPGVPWNSAIELQDWHILGAWIRDRLERTPTCGLADANFYPAEVDESQPWRLMRNHFYNIATLPIDALDWTSIRYAEDFHITLQLIGMGLPNVVNQRYRYTSIATQRPGGCAMEGRTQETHNRAMRKLIKWHNPWVRQSSRTRKGHEDWIKVTIRWRDYWAHVRKEQGL